MPDNDIVDVAGRTLIDRISMSGFGATPPFWSPSEDPKHPVNPVVAKIEKFVELDLQAAEQFGGAPNKQLLQLLDKVSTHKTATPAEDVERAGELFLKDLKHKAPSATEACLFLASAEMSVIQGMNAHDPAVTATAASKFVKGDSDGHAAAKKAIAGTNYIMGAIGGFLNEVVNETVDGIKQIHSLFVHPAPGQGTFYNPDGPLGSTPADSSFGGLTSGASVAPATAPSAPKPRAPAPAAH
jgi:hypothetical protein